MAALAAVLVIGAALSLYAGVFADTRPEPPERTVSQLVLDTVREEARSQGGIDPDALRVPPGTLPAGWQVNLTLRTLIGTVSAGSRAPPDAARVEDIVTVRYGPGNLRPGLLIVEAWQ